MVCPKCKAEIDSVHVLSLCSQDCSLDSNTIDNWGSITVLDTQSIECSVCYEDITEFVKQGC